MSIDFGDKNKKELHDKELELMLRELELVKQEKGMLLNNHTLVTMKNRIYIKALAENSWPGYKICKKDAQGNVSEL